MGRKKIRNPYDGRKHVITVRLKYWEHQELSSFSSKLDMSVSETCRILISSGMNHINQAIIDEAKDAARPKMTGRSSDLCDMY